MLPVVVLRLGTKDFCINDDTNQVGPVGSGEHSCVHSEAREYCFCFVHDCKAMYPSKHSTLRPEQKSRRRPDRRKISHCHLHGSRLRAACCAA